MIVLTFLFICYMSAPVPNDPIKVAIHNCFINTVENIGCKADEKNKCVDVYIQVQESDETGNNAYELEYSTRYDLMCIKYHVLHEFSKTFNIYFDDNVSQIDTSNSVINYVFLKSQNLLYANGKMTKVQILFVEIPNNNVNDCEEDVKQLREDFLKKI